MPDTIDGNVDPVASRRPSDLLTVRVLLVALAVLLAGYMFLGRGFAHLGMRPIFVGEVVLVLGLIATTFAIVRLRLRPVPSRIVWLLLAFMVLGVARTVPYLGVNGVDALRDAVLWGYAVFALMIYVLADRTLLLTTMRAYGWVVPIFALWLPISWNIFVLEYQNIDVNKLGSFTPLVFFKSGDMAVHAVGSIAFLVLGTTAIATTRGFVLRTIVALPLVWTLFLTGTSSRGAMLAWAAGLGVVALFARRSRTWIPVLVATAVLVVGLVSPALLSDLGRQIPQPTPSGASTPSPSGSVLFLYSSGNKSVSEFMSATFAPNVSPSKCGERNASDFRASNSTPITSASLRLIQVISEEDISVR